MTMAWSVRGIPILKTSPDWSWPDFPSACSTAFQSGSAACTTPTGLATRRSIPSNRARRFIGHLPCSCRRFLPQHGMETVEERDAPLEQIVVVGVAGGERADGQIHAGRLLAGELAVPQIGFVHDLCDDLDPPILDAEALDEGLEGAVLPVMAEVRPDHIEGNALARGIRRVGEGELRLGIAEAANEPSRGEAIDVGPRPRHPGTPAGGERGAVRPGSRTRPRLRRAEPLRRGLPETSRALTGR